MYLNKKYDITLLGHSLFSYLLGLNFIERHKKVLLINDPTMHLGHYFTHSLGLFEVRYLEAWGQELKLRELQDLTPYLQERPWQFHFSSPCNGPRLKLRLHGPPSLRLRELRRKLPQLFAVAQELDSWDLAQFDQEMERYLERMVDHCFRFQTETSLGVEVYSDNRPPMVEALYQQLKEGRERPVSPPQEGLVKCFWQTLRCLCQYNLSPLSSELEYAHLFVQLFCPRFELDHQALCEVLADPFVIRGGLIKNSRIEEWDFKRDDIWALQLSSFEGVTFPREVFFLGNEGHGQQVDFSGHQDLMASFYRSFHHPAGAWTPYAVFGPEEHIFVPLEQMGGEWPFFLWRRISPEKSQLLLFQRFKRPLPLRPPAGLGEQLIQQLLEEHDGPLQGEWGPWERGHDVYYYRPHGLPAPGRLKARRGPQLASTQLMHFRSPHKYRKIRSLHYIGPRTGPLLGHLSCYLAIKNAAGLL